MPFARKAIDFSATKRIESGHEPPNFREGYEEWRVAFLKGRAGIYSLQVKDALAIAEETWRSGVGCGHTSQ